MEDLIVSAVISNIRGLKTEDVLDSENMIEGQLPKISWVRADKIYTLSKGMIVKKYGTVDSTKVMEVKIRLMKLNN